MDCSRTHVDLASADRMVSVAKAESLKRADEINRKLMDQHQQEVGSAIIILLFDKQCFCTPETK